MMTFLKSIMLPVAKSDDRDEMQSFALTFAIALPIIFMLILPWLLSGPIPQWPIFISLVLVLCYFFAPLLLYPVYRVWMVIASILAWTNTVLLLSIIYFLMILPIGVVLRIFKKLDYQEKITSNSNWKQINKNTEKHRFKEPF